MIVDLSVFRDTTILLERYMQLVPPLNRVDIRFILASLTYADLSPDFIAHLRYLYANTPEAKTWERSDFSDIEEDGLYKHFQDERFHDPVYPAHFKLKTSDGVISLRSNIKDISRSSLEIPHIIQNAGVVIPNNHDEYMIRVASNTEIEILFNPMDNVGEFYSYRELVNLGYEQLGSDWVIESSDGIYAISSLGDLIEPIFFTVDNSTFRAAATERHTIWIYANSKDPAKVNKLIFIVRGQVAEYNGESIKSNLQEQL